MLPHLQFWHNICVRRGYRFNEAIGWIGDSKKSDYFYDELEEDLLLQCLGQGDMYEPVDTCMVYANYADDSAATHLWPTQDLWARAAWRIVQDNCGEDQVFGKVLKYHAAKAYGFAIDILCISFHSMAHRGSESLWTEIITSNAFTQGPSASVFHTWSWSAEQQMATDMDPDGDDTYQSGEELEPDLDYDSHSDAAETGISTLSDGESEYVEIQTPRNRKSTAFQPASPVTPTKLGKRPHHFEDEEPSPSKKVKLSVRTRSPKDSEQGTENMLKLYDEAGLPITGYRAAAL